MTKPVIRNYEDLMAEKQRLKQNSKESRQQISASFNALKDELNPFDGIRHTVKEAFSGDKTNPVVKLGIRKATDLVFNKFLLKNAPWPLRLLLPLAVKEVAGRLIGDKPDKKTAALLHRLAAKIRGSRPPGPPRRSRRRA
ncbi:hypothetical protein GCM10027051_28800 [Niabella terrae]